jgi:uncharacterized protein (DUF302 family)
MIDEYTVKHFEHISTRSFDEIISIFESTVGYGDDGKFLNGMMAVTRAEDYERLCTSFLGSSGFMHVLTFDQGKWLSLYGPAARAKQYTYGNPLLAATMVKHDIGVCLQVPFRMLIYEAASGAVHISYDLPSSLVARLHNDEVDMAALKIDPKVIAFATELAGAPA